MDTMKDAKVPLPSEYLTTRGWHKVHPDMHNENTMWFHRDRPEHEYYFIDALRQEWHSDEIAKQETEAK